MQAIIAGRNDIAITASVSRSVLSLIIGGVPQQPARKSGRVLIAARVLGAREPARIIERGQRSLHDMEAARLFAGSLATIERMRTGVEYDERIDLETQVDLRARLREPTCPANSAPSAATATLLNRFTFAARSRLVSPYFATSTRKQSWPLWCQSLRYDW